MVRLYDLNNTVFVTRNFSRLDETFETRFMFYTEFVFIAFHWEFTIEINSNWNLILNSVAIFLKL